MSLHPLRFVHRGAVVALGNVPPDRTLLELLREDLHCTAAKEGCASGDCGACTVTVAEQGDDGALHYRAVNSCIRLAHSIDGQALWTAADIARGAATSNRAADAADLHPAQRALLECHGSQCGFCTPGFAMSLFTLHRQRRGAVDGLTRHEIETALSGNLCRCTGYRPIVDAAHTMHHWPAPPSDETETLQLLEQLNKTDCRPAPDISSKPGAQPFYARPADLAQLLALRTAHPDALLVAGATDVGLWITKLQRRYAQVIDTTRVRELRAIEHGADGALAIGAAVPLTEAFAALGQRHPDVQGFLARFAGLPIRNSGTLGGNVANGSPIGDSMPLLIALGAAVVLASARGERRLPIEDFYLAYRKTALAADEVLARIELPALFDERTEPPPGRPKVASALSGGPLVRADKISKRFEDDISAVCLAVALRVQDGRIAHVRLGVGGVAAVPARATKTEAHLVDRTPTTTTFRAAVEALQAEFEPISDMRASSAYRRAALGALLMRTHDQLHGQREPTLLDLAPL